MRIPIKLQSLIIGATLSSLFIALTAWSWRTWPDVLVDFGHELYIPWQMSLGKLLYRDLRWTMGPLSQQFNCLLFRSFGVSLETLIFANLIILAIIAWLLYRVFSTLGERFEAAILCAFFLSVFGFSQYVGVANYNYVCPYRHEMTHGILLCLLLVLTLRQCLQSAQPLGYAAAGLLSGLVFLTKAEICLGATAAIGAAGACAIITNAWGNGNRLRNLILFVISLLLPIVLFTLILWRHVPLAEACRSILANIHYSLSDNLTVGYKFYAVNMGLTDVPGNLWLMVTSSAIIVLALVVAAGIDRFLSRFIPCVDMAGFGVPLLSGPTSKIVEENDRLKAELRTFPTAVNGYCTRNALMRLVIPLMAAIITFSFCAKRVTYADWQQLWRALPVVTVTAGAYGFWRCIAARRRGERSVDYAVIVIWSAMSLALLAKMLLRARIDHYGFVLAMPATLLAAAFCLARIPAGLHARYGGGTIVRALAIAVLAAIVFAYLRKSSDYYRYKELPIGTGADRFFTFSPENSHRGYLVQQAMHNLRQRMGADETLLILPEGITVNYLLRKTNPTPYHLLTPWEMTAFGGEKSILSDIIAGAPDYIGLFHIDMTDHGQPYFGVPGYGADIVHWIRTHYEVIARFQVQPANPGDFRIELYRQRVEIHQRP